MCIAYSPAYSTAFSPAQHLGTACGFSSTDSGMATTLTCVAAENGVCLSAENGSVIYETESSAPFSALAAEASDFLSGENGFVLLQE